MTIKEDFLENFRAELQTELDTLLSGESTVVQEFNDAAEVFPTTIVNFQTGNSPYRYVGGRRRAVVNILISNLAIRPTDSSHIITCSDAVVRSGRTLVEYLCVKIFNHLERYQPSFSYVDNNVDMRINMDFEERDDVYKSEVEYQLLV